MLNVTVICVGKIKEKYFTDALAEYTKRLGRFCKLNIIEVKDEATPDNPSKAEKDLVLNREGERIKSKMPKNGHVISLCVEGMQQSSEELATCIEDLTLRGVSHIVFVIGGSMGIADDIKGLSKTRLSFSKMTYPHQLMRVVLLEQVYRAFTINNGITYHK